MHLEVDLLIQNKGGKDTTVSNIFAEVRIDKPISVTHSAEGTIFYKEPDGKLVSAPVSLPAGDSKNLHLAFALEGVDPLAVERSVPTLNTKLSLQMPIKVSFTIRHTQGALRGDWPVYGKHQELHQRLIHWMCQKDMREGKPHWVQK